jgi:hypothetical protein
MLSVLLYSALLMLPKEPPPQLEGWPSILITYRMYEWFPILIIATLLEMAVLRKISDANWLGALKAAGFSNIAAGVVGIVLLPLAGVVWKYSLHITVEGVFGVLGHYSMASWVGNVMYMAMFLGAFKALIVSVVTEKKLTFGFVSFWILINLIPLLLAIASFTVKAYDPILL